MNFEDFAVIFIAILAITALILFLCDEPEKAKSQGSAPEIFTQEEQFYTDLFLLKYDLDADAFETSKQMLAEILGNEQML